jgi:hypothetical protein
MVELNEQELVFCEEKFLDYDEAIFEGRDLKYKKRALAQLIKIFQTLTKEKHIHPEVIEDDYVQYSSSVNLSGSQRFTLLVTPNPWHGMSEKILTEENTFAIETFKGKVEETINPIENEDEYPDYLDIMQRIIVENSVERRS